MPLTAQVPVPPAPPAVGLATPPSATGAAVRPWSRPMELGFAFILGCVALGLVQLLWQRVGTAPQPAIVLSLPPIDLNLADEATLSQIPGIGPQRAKSIVQHRERHGRFRSFDDLDQVDGLGRYTVDKIRPSLRIQPNELSPASILPTPTRPGESYYRTAPIDLNTAVAEQLQRLPGIGPVLAQRIVQDRETRGPFQKLDDLARIHGIKAKTIDKIRPYVVVRPAGTAVTSRDPI